MKIILKCQEPIEHNLKDLTYIGSDDTCQVRLLSPSISDRHLRIEKKDDRFFARDNRSQTGVLLNRKRIHETTEIQSGDVLHVGEFEFFVCEDEEKIFPLASKNEKWNSKLLKLASAARSDFSILLLGPSGAGKEVLANAIHSSSFRRRGPFISVNCSAMTESLIESELFGHVKGSFTGAVADRKGAFESAREGTLFLDEIGDLPLALQAKLLRALENSEIRPVGSDKNITTDVRVVAATNLNLKEKVSTGEFREDLYYRLNVVEVQAPTLVERMDDFEDLLMHFAKMMKVRFQFAAISLLKTHNWQGNIRELRNLVWRASAIYGREEITPDIIRELLPELNQSSDSSNNEQSSTSMPLIKELERQMIVQRLSVNKGNQRRTAKDLGLPKSTLHDRMRSYGIDISKYKVV